jgi:hypothetical protein
MYTIPVVFPLFCPPLHFWSEEKSPFYVGKMHAILAVKTNTNSSCESFSVKLASNREITKKIYSSDKFHAIAKIFS